MLSAEQLQQLADVPVSFGLTRAHVIAWRGLFEAEELTAATSRRKLSAVSFALRIPL